MNNVVAGQAHAVVVDIEAASQLSVAMVENSVPLVARVSLTNTSDAALSNLAMLDVGQAARLSPLFD